MVAQQPVWSDWAMHMFDWAYRVIKHVGNYGESFDRNVGAGSRLKIARGVNALWNKGGLQYAPPIR